MGNTVTHPGQLNLGVRLSGPDLEGGDLAGWTKNKRLSLLTCTRCLAVPTTNVAVSEVS